MHHCHTATAPQWDNLPNTVHIRESVAIGTFVFDARASDKNTLRWAPNGDVIYYTLNHPQFTIDQSTGMQKKKKGTCFGTNGSVILIPHIICHHKLTHVGNYCNCHLFWGEKNFWIPIWHRTNFNFKKFTYWCL